MTKRAKYIGKFVEELTELASNGLYLRSHARKPQSDSIEDQQRHKESKAYLEKTEMKLKAYVAEILENNSEQAEALMIELGVQWKRPEVKSEDDASNNAS